MSYLDDHHTSAGSISLVVAVAIAGVLIAAGFFITLEDQRHLEKTVADIERSLATTTATLTETKNVLDTIIANNQDLQDQLAAAQESQELVEAALEQTARQVGGLSTELEGKVSEQTLGARILEWEPRVARIECRFQDGDDTVDAKASAVAVYRAGNVSFMTNRHVLEHKDMPLEKCELRAPGISGDFDIEPSQMEISTERDIAYLSVSTPPPALVTTASGISICAAEPSVGSRVLILGYPRTGSERGITATEGIISGIEEEFYITSAKIERGNSGGAAISVEDNCFLGLPTLVVVGQLESLARILPVTSL
ncbi:MAG: serine protease [Candidatus Paceibacterota bacterium]